MPSQSHPLVTEVGVVCREDPILKFIPSGKAVCEFSIRVPGSKARGDRPATEARFVDVVCWEELGENVAESVTKGDRVIVRGLLKTDNYTGSDGKEKSRTKLTAWNVGPDLSFATAQITRNERLEPAPPPSGGDFQDF